MPDPKKSKPSRLAAKNSGLTSPNLSTGPCYLEAFHCEGFYTIGSLSLTDLGDKKEIYFLGENGDGKTLLLQSLLLTLKHQDILNASSKEETGAALDLLSSGRGKLSALDTLGKKTEIDIAPTGHQKTVSFRGDREGNAPVFAYGAYRGKSSDAGDSYGFMTLFDAKQTRQPKMLRDPVAWLKYLYTLKLEAELNRPATVQVPPLDVVLGMVENILGRDVRIEVNASDVTFKELESPLKLHQLSEGFRSVLTWVLDLLQGLAHYQPQVTSIRDYFGIVLVDEISLHLHPKWELQFVRQLRSWFPKIQFMMSTHSPISIMGSSADAIYFRVYKKAGQTYVSEAFENRDLRQFLANSIITSPLFGLEDARMTASDGHVNTSDSYLGIKIQEYVKDHLRASATPYYAPNEITALVDKAFKELDP